MTLEQLKKMVKGGDSTIDESSLCVEGDNQRKTHRRHGKKSWSEDLFLKTIRAMHLPLPVQEYRFHPDRKWEFDFAWPDHKVALEIEGGTRSGGAHGSASGILRDMRKYNAAQHLGWIVIRALPEWVPGKTMAMDCTLADQLNHVLTIREPLELAMLARKWDQEIEALENESGSNDIPKAANNDAV